MKIKVLLFGVFFSCSVISAQADFRPGYIINNDRDTIVGEIDYQGEQVNSTICTFKNLDGQIQALSPIDIHAYRFSDSNFYVSKIVDGIYYFLEYLIKGKISLYYLRTEKGSQYFLEKDSSGLIRIPYEEDIRYINNTKTFYQSKKHVGILTYYMKEAPELKSRIDLIKEPEHQNLIKLAVDYHNSVCPDQECTIYKRRIQLPNLSIEFFTGYRGSKDYNMPAYEFGGHIYIGSPRINQNMFIKTGMSLHPGSAIQEVESRIMRFPIQILYINKANRIQPKFGGGINMFYLKIEDYSVLDHFISLNAGIDFKISEFLTLITTIDSEFTSLANIISSKNVNFHMVSYSVNLGFRLDLLKY